MISVVNSASGMILAVLFAMFIHAFLSSLYITGSSLLLCCEGYTVSFCSIIKYAFFIVLSSV